MKIPFLAACLFLAAVPRLQAQPEPHPANPGIQAIVEQISADSLLNAISSLTAFYTRHTFSDTTSDSIGIGAAMRWVQTTGESYDAGGRFSWEWFPWTGTFNGSPLTRHDLIARIAGSDSARFIIGGHLDSRAASISDNTGFAPGADDNGSSCAALLELLRILPDSLAHNLELVWFTGEEQGLWGSEAYAQHLAQQGVRVDGMIAMDMISHIAAPGGAIDSMSLRLYADGNLNQGGTASPARTLERYLRWVGEAYAGVEGFSMVVYAAADRPGRGSDHLSFSDAGYPSVRVIERNEDLNYQHGPNDIPQNLSPTYARRLAMCTIGGLLTMLQAPERPSPPLSEQIASNRVLVTIPDSIALPEGGRFYAAMRDYYHPDFDEIADLGTARQYEFTVGADPLYGFCISREDSMGLPSPFSDETLVDILGAGEYRPVLPATMNFTAAPNPFNAEVTLRFDLARSGSVSVVVYELSGRLVTRLMDGYHPAGHIELQWSPEHRATGIYLARLTSPDGIRTLKIAYVR